MEYIFAALIFALSVWVYKDARTRNIANPERWGVGTAFIFIIIAPLYFFKRKSFRELVNPTTKMIMSGKRIKKR